MFCGEPIFSLYAVISAYTHVKSPRIQRIYFIQIQPANSLLELSSILQKKHISRHRQYWSYLRIVCGTTGMLENINRHPENTLQRVTIWQMCNCTWETENSLYPHSYKACVYSENWEPSLFHGKQVQIPPPKLGITSVSQITANPQPGIHPLLTKKGTSCSIMYQARPHGFVLACFNSVSHKISVRIPIGRVSLCYVSTGSSAHSAARCSVSILKINSHAIDPPS